MIKIITLAVLFMATLYADMNYRDVTYNIREFAPEMPDENSSSVDVQTNRLEITEQYATTLMDTNETTEVILNDNGSVSYGTQDSSGYIVLTLPEKCIDENSTSDNNTTVSLKSFNVIKDAKEKRIALGLNPAINAEERAYNYSQVASTKCIKAILADDTEITRCGECASKFLPSMNTKVTNEDNTTQYMPNNARIKQFYQYDATKNASTALLMKMQSNNAIGARINATGPDTYDPEFIPADLADSKEANITSRAEQLNQTLSAAGIRAKLTKCFVRRELVPQYYCPIPGMENGAVTGGNAEDDQAKAKETCDSYCESQSYGCRSADTGFTKSVSINDTVVYNFGSSNNNQASQTITIPINSALELKKINYTVTKSFPSEEKTQSDAATQAKIFMRINISYRPVGKTSFVALDGPSVFRLDSNQSVFSIPQAPNAEEIRITFYTPYILRDGAYMESNIEDVLSSVTVDGVEVEYTDDKYYFCSLEQVVIDPTTQCMDGEAFELNSVEGSFIACKSDTKIQGPESKFGAFFTEESCEASCTIKKQCVQTFANYAGDAMSEAAYNITVGCVDDEHNTNCSPSLCEEMYNQNKMPVEEFVYDNSQTVRKTVTSGVQIAGVTRPKINLAAEKAAASSDPQSTYDSVFLDEMKDAAYQQMISSRSYDYSINKVGEGAPFEYAYRGETDASVNTATLTNSIPDSVIYWKLKPASYDIGTGNTYYLYKIIKSEQMFKPISGAFMEDEGEFAQSTITYTPKRSYKDYVYSFVTSTGNSPFYIKEYAQVYIDGNSSEIVGKGWVTNTQHAGEKYIAYDSVDDIYVNSSDSVTAKHSETTNFDGLKNYEEFEFIGDVVNYLTNEQDGGAIQTQSFINQTNLPIKHYAVAKKEANKHAAVLNYSLYGIYSDTQLTQKDIMDKLNAADGEKYLVYRATKGSENKTEIYGDGANRKDRLKLFLKGVPNSTSLTIDVVPEIEEEGKDVIFFMYMFEGDMQ